MKADLLLVKLFMQFNFILHCIRLKKVFLHIKKLYIMYSSISELGQNSQKVDAKGSEMMLNFTFPVAKT